MHRSKRPIEPESCFGNIKFNHDFKRFHLKPTRKTKVEWGLVLLANNLRKYFDHKAKIREKYAQSMIMVVEKTLRRPLDSCRKALTERGRPRPRERLPKERSSEGWMKKRNSGGAFRQHIIAIYNARNRPFWGGFISEAFLQNAYNIVGLSHGVEMYGWNSMCNQVLALERAPLCTYIIYGFLVIASLADFLGQLERNVQ